MLNVLESSLPWMGHIFFQHIEITFVYFAWDIFSPALTLTRIDAAIILQNIIVFCIKQSNLNIASW